MDPCLSVFIRGHRSLFQMLFESVFRLPDRQPQKKMACRAIAGLLNANRGVRCADRRPCSGVPGLPVVSGCRHSPAASSDSRPIVKDVAVRETDCPRRGGPHCGRIVGEYVAFRVDRRAVGGIQSDRALCNDGVTDRGHSVSDVDGRVRGITNSHSLQRGLDWPCPWVHVEAGKAARDGRILYDDVL